MEIESLETIIPTCTCLAISCVTRVARARKWSMCVCACCFIWIRITVMATAGAFVNIWKRIRIAVLSQQYEHENARLDLLFKIPRKKKSIGIWNLCFYNILEDHDTIIPTCTCVSVSCVTRVARAGKWSLCVCACCFVWIRITVMATTCTFVNIWKKIVVVWLHVASNSAIHILLSLVEYLISNQWYLFQHQFCICRFSYSWNIIQEQQKMGCSRT